MRWGWLERLRRGIAARPIVPLPRGQQSLPDYQWEIFSAFSIGAGDVGVIGRDEAVRVRDLYTGFAGSGRFTMMFASEWTPVLVFASNAYTPANERLIAAAKGSQLAYVRGTARVRPRRPGRQDAASFLSDFTIDLRAHRAVIDDFAAGVP